MSSIFTVKFKSDNFVDELKDSLFDKGCLTISSFSNPYVKKLTSKFGYKHLINNKTLYEKLSVFTSAYVDLKKAALESRKIELNLQEFVGNLLCLGD